MKHPASAKAITTFLGLLFGVALFAFTPPSASATLSVVCENSRSCGSADEYCQKDPNIPIGYCAPMPEGHSLNNLPPDAYAATANALAPQNNANTPNPPASSGVSSGTVQVPPENNSSAPSATTDATEDGKSSVSAEDFTRQGTITLNSPVSCEGDSCSIPQLIARIIQYLLGFIGALAVLMIVIGGIMYMASGGSSNVTGQAKRTISYTIIGLVIAFLALFIVRLVLQVLGAA